MTLTTSLWLLNLKLFFFIDGATWESVPGMIQERSDHACEVRNNRTVRRCCPHDYKCGPHPHIYTQSYLNSYPHIYPYSPPHSSPKVTRTTTRTATRKIIRPVTRTFIRTTVTIFILKVIQYVHDDVWETGILVAGGYRSHGAWTNTVEFFNFEKGK